MVNDKAPLYFIDSNIFLRTLIKEDEKSFNACYKFLEKVHSKQIQAQTSDLVLAEVNWVLESYYKFSKEQVISALEGIVNLNGLTIKSNSNCPAAISLFKKSKVKFIDALIASDKLFGGNSVIVSYDKDFDKLGLSRIKP